MSQDIRNLQPTSLWNRFSDLNAVPRPSKKEERVIQFAKEFGENLGLETKVDGVGNVIIKKPASPGMEGRKTIVMQSHLDMVCQKNSGTNFDFDNQGIKMLVQDDWVVADGTTLGADNGIGVAAIMAILESESIEHPPIEALFTIDEETGMTGAMGLQGGMLDGEILLNLDTEDDDELTIGCAGGVDVTASGTYNEESLSVDSVGYKITVNGLTGGHSGMDIILGRANANKVMNRILWQTYSNFGLRIGSIDGGGLRNAIPRESFAVVAVPDSQNTPFEAYIKKQFEEIRSEYTTTDPDLSISLEKTTAPAQVMQEEFQDALIGAIYGCPNGIYRMSSDVEGLVQTSNNLARVVAGNGDYYVSCLTRSAVESEKWDEVRSIQSGFEAIGANVSTDGSYPGWAPAPSSSIVSLMSNLYREMFNEEPNVMACHAGLECGILGTNYPDMEMISFGPNIRGAHSPDEKVQISSVQKFWGYLLETLKRIPEVA
jgi:dipeptidase D